MKDGQTIGQWLNWDFEANGDLEIRDKNGKRIYYERSNGFWRKREYDSEDKLLRNIKWRNRRQPHFQSH
jgi:hypothetical protein